MDAEWLLSRTYRGLSYRLGRLVFERGRPQPESTTHAVLGPGQSGVAVHVPRVGGRLDPGACDDSFARAQNFFPRHFQDNPVAFDCHSWLMDDQLGHYLPATSNIIRFQRRFAFFNDNEPADHEILALVFARRYDGPHVPGELLDELPQDTTLQRAIVTHLHRGGHWHSRTGWCPLPMPARLC
ncbi:hypothetical protein ABN028_34555 [Actinopolymorpha sp. B17G11]|uniref:hypothetical protein n=1 Tax=Actinopolymorpha sp. B17G11 TaxID=3160861 RepID=UPI0032E4200F